VADRHLHLLIPVAVGLCGTWIDLANARSPRAIVEALVLTFFGLLCGAAVGVAAALFAPHSRPLALAAAVATAVLGIAMFVRLVLIVRRRVVPPALPFGVPAVAVAMLGTMVLLWHHLRTMISGSTP
jgi:hypothetical protein